MDTSIRPLWRGPAVNDVEEIDEEDGTGASGSGLEDPELIVFEEEDKVIKKLVDPKLPSRADVDMHILMGHIPYRNWCPICVKAQGREASHFRDKREERLLPEYSWDYCFPGDELGYK